MPEEQSQSEGLIRDAVTADIDDCATLYLNGDPQLRVRSPQYRKEKEKMLKGAIADPGYRTRVFEMDGAVRAFLTYGVSDGIKGYPHIYWLYVSEAYRGKRIGPTLIQDAKAGTVGPGLTLWVDPFNEVAIGVYKREGFKQVKPPAPTVQEGKVLMAWTR
jgi:ribosomal protein S18 acetylase RimI-like enzyme